MAILLYTLLANILIGIGIISIILIIKLFKKQIIQHAHQITALTVGLLLGIIFLGFLPEIEEGLRETSGFYILLGLLLFFLLETILHRHHCKEIEGPCEKKLHQHEHGNSLLINISTFLHNALHGLVIFGAFSIDTKLGIITTISILLHSIPQNIANYLLSIDKEKIVYIAALGGVIGTILLFPFVNILLEQKNIILALVAGGLLYIALSDILPEFRFKGKNYEKILYFSLVILGIILFYILKMLLSKG